MQFREELKSPSKNSPFHESASSLKGLIHAFLYLFDASHLHGYYRLMEHYLASIHRLSHIDNAGLKKRINGGIRQMAVRLGFTVGPLIGGFLWDNLDPAVSFYAVIFFFAASFILILLLKDNSRKF